MIRRIRRSRAKWRGNAFFCALAKASRAFQGHCVATWRPEHWVRTRAAEIKPDGFGRYLYPGRACEFYLEYDRATEASRALSRKLEGYLKLAAGWTRDQELTGFPNLLVLVPEEGREAEVASAFRSATTSLHVSGSLASSFPLYVASEDLLFEVGVLGAVWKHVPTNGERLSLIELPARSRDLYRTTRCIGRYFTDADPSHRRRISPASATPQFRALPPRHAPSGRGADTRQTKPNSSSGAGSATNPRRWNANGAGTLSTSLGNGTRQRPMLASGLSRGRCSRSPSS